MVGFGLTVKHPAQAAKPPSGLVMVSVRAPSAAFFPTLTSRLTDVSLFVTAPCTLTSPPEIAALTPYAQNGRRLNAFGTLALVP